jgi:hypothetical protein
MKEKLAKCSVAGKSYIASNCVAVGTRCCMSFRRGSDGDATRGNSGLEHIGSNRYAAGSSSLKSEHVVLIEEFLHWMLFTARSRLMKSRTRTEQLEPSSRSRMRSWHRRRSFQIPHFDIQRHSSALLTGLVRDAGLGARHYMLHPGAVVISDRTVAHGDFQPFSGDVAGRSGTSSATSVIAASRRNFTTKQHR